MVRRHSSTRAISSSAAPSAPPQSSAAQSLRVTPLKVGDSFSSTTTLRLAAERMLLAQGRTLVSDHRVTGGHQRMYRCSAAKIVKGQKGISGGCPVFVKANKRKDNQFYVTGCSFDHRAGGKKKPSLRALGEESAVVVNANRKITAPAIVKALRAPTASSSNRTQRTVSSGAWSAFPRRRTGTDTSGWRATSTCSRPAVRGRSPTIRCVGPSVMYMDSVAFLELLLMLCRFRFSRVENLKKDLNWNLNQRLGATTASCWCACPLTARKKLKQCWVGGVHLGPTSLTWLYSVSFAACISLQMFPA